MSGTDKLAALLHEAGGGSIPPKPEDPDELRIEALQKALDNTTPEYAGCPWDNDGKKEEAAEKGIWIAGSDE